MYPLTVPIPVFMQEHISLAPYTTLRVGGPARYFAEISDLDQLLEAIAFAHRRQLPIFVLGGGSNLLVTDKGFDGVVLHVRFTTWAPVEYTVGEPEPHLVTVSITGGTEWDDFVLSVCKLNLSGVECLAGIPGFVGASPIQNIGAYGQEAAQTIHSATVFDLQTMKPLTLSRQECGFAYRTSIFNTTHRGRYVVLGVTFRLDPLARPKLTYPDLLKHFGEAASPTPLEVYHAVRSIRQGKGMLLASGEKADDPDLRSAGSFFKNPIVPLEMLAHVAKALGLDEANVPHWKAGEGMVKLPAAWILERAGFHKGFVMGAAGISSKHSLALINRSGSASYREMAALRDAIVGEVKAKFGITLEQEPVQLGL